MKCIVKSLCALACVLSVTGCAGGIGFGDSITTEAIAKQYGLDFPKDDATGQCTPKKERKSPANALSIADWLTCYQIPADAQADEARLYRAQAIAATFAQYAAFTIGPGEEKAESDALTAIGAINESQRRIQNALKGEAEFEGLPNVVRVRTMNGALNVMMVALQPTARKARSSFLNIANLITDTPRALLGSETSIEGLKNFLIANRTVNTYITAFRADLINKMVTLQGTETIDEAAPNGKTRKIQKWQDTQDARDWEPLRKVMQKACDKLLVASNQEDLKCKGLVVKET